MVKVGVVGLGFMGATHIRAYQQIPDAEIVAVCDAVRLPVDGVLALAGNVGGGGDVRLDMNRVKATKDYQEFLANPEVELVDLCVPTLLHGPQSIAALRAGKHVICEKPLARTVAVAREIVAAAAAAKGYFMPAMCMRFWPGWNWLKKAVDEAAYGRPLAARFRRVSSPPGWSRGTYFKGDESGGALFDLHVHDIDFVQFLFGRPRSVFAQGLSRFSGAFDHILAQYEVAGGALVSAEGSWLMTEGFGFNMAYTIVFEKATADFDLSRGGEALRIFEEGQAPRTVQIEPGDGYVGELTHMVQSIRQGQPPCVVTAPDGLSAVEIAEAEEQSAKTGQVVRL